MDPEIYGFDFLQKCAWQIETHKHCLSSMRTSLSLYIYIYVYIYIYMYIGILFKVISEVIFQASSPQDPRCKSSGAVTT